MAQNVSAMVNVKTTFGSRGNLHLSLNLGVGIFKRIDFFTPAINGSLTVFSGGLGAPGGSFGNIGYDLIFSPSLTLGFDDAIEHSLHTMNHRMITSVANDFRYSIIHAQNIVISRNNPFQRSGSYGFRVGDFSLQSYNDVIYFLGDADDRFWTGGFSITISIDVDNIIQIGNDVYTGAREPGNPRRPQVPRRGRPFTYYVQRPAWQVLNMGKTYISWTNRSDQFQIELSHSGELDMFFQNFIHRWTRSPWFNSTTQNSVNLGGSYYYEL